MAEPASEPSAADAPDSTAEGTAAGEVEGGCSLCGRSRGDHAEMAHEFASRSDKSRKLRAKKTPPPPKIEPGSAGATSAPPEPKIVQLGPPPDLALRLALIDAGVVTVDQIETAETKLRAVGAAADPTLGHAANASLGDTLRAAAKAERDAAISAAAEQAAGSRSGR